MKKIILSAALLGVAGVASAFAGPTISGGGDIASASIIRNTLGAAPEGGTLAAATNPGAANAGGVVAVDKSGSNLTMTLTSSGFTAAADSLAGLGTVDARGNIVIEGAGLQTLASNVGVAPGDLTVKKLTIKKAGI